MKSFTYQGNLIQQRQNGFLNLTQMCRANGKKINDWLRLKVSKAYIDEVSAVTGIPVTELIDVVQGGDPGLQGSWGHKLLAINLARWISPRFSVWCDSHIWNLIDSGSTSLNIDPTEKLRYETERLRYQNLKMQAKREANKRALWESDPALYQMLVDGVPAREVKALAPVKTELVERHTLESNGHSLTKFMADLGNLERTKSGQFKQGDRDLIKQLLLELGIDLSTGDGCNKNERVVTSHSIPDEKYNEALAHVRAVLRIRDPNLLEQLLLLPFN